MGLHNCNLPTTSNRRDLAHKRTSLRTKSRAARGDKPHAIIGTEFSGILRGAGVSSKRVKKVQRNKLYAAERKKVAAAEELLKMKGEVVMEDVATAPLSKRQQKIAARVEKVKDANAAARAAIKAEAQKKEEEAAKNAEEEGAEATMELDDI